ncbi:hypothetical protein AYI68_g1186 [Smittium mucronatum]|uniref:Uncharacterized protein n=1 Tax=Smittium mucronatum TaxID=133383 RepID=A0A1R0H6C7_9FUNG|nr:hypothetical protein AYI68_g1186 [Smittium mucronatum]
MVTIQGDIREIELNSWNPRGEPVFFPTEQEVGSILLFFLGTQDHGAELIDVQMAVLEQSILLITLEPNITFGLKAAQGVNNHNASHPHVEICIMVSRSEDIFHITAPVTAINDGNSRPRKRKVSALYQKVLEVIGIEDQLSFLEA